jgi:hypothetical protein
VRRLSRASSSSATAAPAISSPPPTGLALHRGSAPSPGRTWPSKASRERAFAHVISCAVPCPFSINPPLLIGRPDRPRNRQPPVSVDGEVCAASTRDRHVQVQAFRTSSRHCSAVSGRPAPGTHVVRPCLRRTRPADAASRCAQATPAISRGASDRRGVRIPRIFYLGRRLGRLNQAGRA